MVVYFHFKRAMYGSSASKVYLKLKRFSVRLGLAQKPFSVHGVLLILLAFSVCFNVFVYFLQGQGVDVEHDEVICRQDHHKLCNNGSCASGTDVKNGTQKGRVIFRTNNGFAVTSEETLLAGEDSKRKVFLTIGLPTVDRKDLNYLEITLDSLLHNASKTRDINIKIVILLADMKRSVRTRRLQKLTKRYGPYLEQGQIQVIAIPPKAYPPLRGLPTTLDDPEERIYWRSKQAIDFAFLMQYCQHFSPYYLQLEDDVIATRDYDIHMRKFMEEKKDIYWFNLDFSNLGFIGKLYRSETLRNQARFFQLFYSEMPVDLLMSAYRTLLGNDVTKTTYPRNIFQHIGYQSSSS